jgi:predicted RNase H-like nuclease
MSWREMSEDQLSELQPYMLNCSNLSSAVCKQVRREFNLSMARGLVALSREVKRALSQEEVDALQRALVCWFNEEHIPLIAPEIVH